MFIQPAFPRCLAASAGEIILVLSSRFYDKVLSLHEDSATPVSNPLLAFTLIKRLQSDWRNVVHSLEASENTRGNEEGWRVNRRFYLLTQWKGARF